MLSLNNVLKKYSLIPHRYEKNGKVTYIDTKNGRFVIKNGKQNKKIFDYLESRNFNYYPSFINEIEEAYEITPYIEESNIPREQKMQDLIDLVSLLHNKTTHYKEVNSNHYKTLYEDLSNNVAYLYSYYTDLITLIETKVFPSPSEYLLERNISKIYSVLEFVKKEIDEWYELVKNKKKDRFVVVHNNLNLNHFLRNKDSYLVSWEKSKIDKPVFDIYKLYKRHSNDFDFTEILKRYERNYPLLEEERKLLFILIALPDKLELDINEYDLTKETGCLINNIYKTENLISPYYSENAKNNQ